MDKCIRVCVYTLNGFGKSCNILIIDFLCPTLNHWCQERHEPVIEVLHVLDKKKAQLLCP